MKIMSCITEKHSNNCNKYFDFDFGNIKGRGFNSM